jgi:hypothetical protein
MQGKRGLVSILFLMFCATAYGQMVVHAISGQIKAISVPQQTVDLVSGDATNEFKVLTDRHVALSFDNNLRSASVDPDQFNKTGDFAVVYYCGVENDRMAVAIKDLGAGPFQVVKGTVVDFDKKTRLMKVKDPNGKTYSITLGDHLVVDTDMGVDSGRRFDPHKGDPVRVTYATSGNQNTAVFIRSMGWSS